MADIDRRPVIVVLARLAFWLAFAVWIPAVVLIVRSTTYCHVYHAWWFLAMGLGLLPLSAFGVIAAHRGWRWRLVAYLGIRLLSLIALFILIGSSWGFTTHGAHAWEESVGSLEVWPKIVTCLHRATVCERGGFYAGCCQKPAICDGSLSSFANPDCVIFSSNTTILCYTCRICVQSVYHAFQSDWRKVNPIFLSSALGNGLIFIVEISVYLWMLGQQHDLPAPQQQPPPPVGILPGQWEPWMLGQQQPPPPVAMVPGQWEPTAPPVPPNF